MWRESRPIIELILTVSFETRDLLAILSLKYELVINVILSLESIGWGFWIRMTHEHKYNRL